MAKTRCRRSESSEPLRLPPADGLSTRSDAVHYLWRAELLAHVQGRGCICQRRRADSAVHGSVHTGAEPSGSEGVRACEWCTWVRRAVEGMEGTQCLHTEAPCSPALRLSDK